MLTSPTALAQHSSSDHPFESPSTPLSPRPKSKPPAYPSARVAAAVAAIQNGGTGLPPASSGFPEASSRLADARVASEDSNDKADSEWQKNKHNHDTHDENEDDRDEEEDDDDDDDDGTSTQMTHTALSAKHSIPSRTALAASTTAEISTDMAMDSPPSSSEAAHRTAQPPALSKPAWAAAVKMRRIGLSPMSEDEMSNRLSIDQQSADRTFGRSPTPSEGGIRTPKRVPLALSDMSPISRAHHVVSPALSSLLDRTVDLSLTDQELASIVLTDGEDEASLLQLPDEEPSEYVPPTTPKLGGFGVGTDRVKPHREGMRSKATERAARASASASTASTQQTLATQALSSLEAASSSTSVNTNANSKDNGHGGGGSAITNGDGPTDDTFGAYGKRQRSATEGATPSFKQSQLAWGENFWCVVEQPRGQSFFANPQSGECAWAVPSGTFVLPPQSGGQWWELYDEERGLPYFFQTKTRETTWERPKAFVIPMAAIQQSTLGKRFSQTEFDGQVLAALGSLDQIADEGPAKQYMATKRRVLLMESERQREMEKERERNVAWAAQPPGPQSATNQKPRRRQPPPPSQEPSSSTSKKPSGTHKPRRSQSSRTLRDLRSASSSTGKRNGLPPPAPSASTKPHSGRGAGLSTIPSTNSLPIQSGSSRSDPSYEDSSADFPPPASFELRRIVRRERDPVKRKRMAALAAASSETNPPPPVPRLPTTRLSTGDHKVLPADLRREIEAFAIESYAKRHFAVHRSGILRRKTPLEKLLRWQKQPITSPLLALEDSETKKDAVRGFKVILRIMGDRITPVFWPKVPSIPSLQASESNQARGSMFGACTRSPQEPTPRTTEESSRGDASGPSVIMEERWLLERGIASGSAFRDEIFIQTIKQLTSNPRLESRKSGWEWMCVLLVTFAPSRDLHRHLQSFIKGCASSGPSCSSSSSSSLRKKPTSEGPNLTSEEEVIMARYCLGRLANIARRGSRLQTPTIAEIECASEAAFHPGVFGQTLDVIMQRQADVYPEAKVPIVLTFLTDAMLAMDALKAPSVFRTPGDPDLMTKLRVRIEKGHYSLVGLVSQLDGDVSVLASLLKLWFRELEEPLFPPSIYYDCLEAAASPNQSESAKACLRIVQERLPKLNKRVVAFTVSFLQLFCTEQAKEITGLSVEMLAGVFAPNLFLCPHLLDEQQDGSKMAVSLQDEVDGGNGRTDHGRSRHAKATTEDRVPMTLKKNAALEQRFLAHLLLHLDCLTLCKRSRRRGADTQDDEETEVEDDFDFVPMHGHGSPTGALASGQEFPKPSTAVRAEEAEAPSGKQHGAIPEEEEHEDEADNEDVKATWEIMSMALNRGDGNVPDLSAAA